MTYDFFAGARAEIANPGGSLPGSNNFDCRATGKLPVVLVHGTGGNQQTNWATLVPTLRNAGYCVFAVTYGALPRSPWPVSAIGGLTRMESSAETVKAFINRVLAATGASQVNLVGHSEGTLMPTYYLKFLGGARMVNKYISLAPYWKGQDSSGCIRATDTIAALGVDPEAIWPYPQCAQEQYGSSFMRKIWSGGSPYVPGVAYTNIVTRNDGIVTPYTDGLVPGPRTDDAVPGPRTNVAVPGPRTDDAVPGLQVRNIVVQDSCAADRSDHLSIVANPRSAQMVLNALDPARARVVPCVPVSPALP